MLLQQLRSLAAGSRFEKRRKAEKNWRERQRYHGGGYYDWDDD
jgi:hypothetical protein